jgi:hypothetical protein
MLFLITIWLITVQSAPVDMDAESAVSVSAFCQQMTASLFQAVFAAAISMIFIACCYVLKSKFTERSGFLPGKRGYSVKNYLKETMDSFDRRQNVTRIEPVPLWQVPPLKSHRTNR